MTPNFQYLLTNYLSDSLSEAELKEFLSRMLQPEHQPELQRSLDESLANHNFTGLANPAKADVIFENILQAIKPVEASPAVIVTLDTEFVEEPKNNKQKKHSYWWRYAAAAVLLITISTITYFMFVNSDADQQPVSGNQQPAAMPDVAPGIEKALLTLADGTTIDLDSLANGAIAHQGNTVIMKEDGLLAYNADNKNSPTGILYNTITVPRGGEYKSLVLADGTKVWLNSLSSMRFPTAFTGKERIVEITGEVYFEVTKNIAMPFKVKANSMQVEVLGTQFNVNAYEDEAAIKTTLVEGLVKIVNKGKASFLKPGQQASLNTTGEIKVVDDADIEEAVAWKNGVFRFQKADIKTIMRQVCRWYDVEVKYEKEILQTFSGTIPRNVTVSKLFNMLELTGHVHFKIDGKKIAVIP